MAEQMDLKKMTSEWLATPSKYEGFGIDLAAELIIGFWFGIGVILAIVVVDGLNYPIVAKKG